MTWNWIQSYSFPSNVQPRNGSVTRPPCVVDRWAGGSLLGDRKDLSLSLGRGNLAKKDGITIERRIGAFPLCHRNCVVHTDSSKLFKF